LQKKGRDLLKGAGIPPIPGTANPTHMVENVKPVPLSYTLTKKDMQAIEEYIPREAMTGVSRYVGSFAKDVFSAENNITFEEWKSK
jgi:diketogulonate reductase-like aldo/keto reductase